MENSKCKLIFYLYNPIILIISRKLCLFLLFLLLKKLGCNDKNMVAFRIFQIILVKLINIDTLFYLLFKEMKLVEKTGKSK